jgi:hypothetical protein
LQSGLQFSSLERDFFRLLDTGRGRMRGRMGEEGKRGRGEENI